MMRRLITQFWHKGILSTFLVGVFALLPIVITFGIMAWVGGLPNELERNQDGVAKATEQKEQG